MHKSLSALLIAAALLGGCADSGTTTDDLQDAGGPDGTGGNVTTPPASGADLLGAASIVADAVNGTAPLPVNFTLDAEGADANTTWSLDLGDGNATDGVGLPATVSHTYNATGNLTALFVATAGNSTTEATLNLSVAAAAAPAPALPDTTHWEFGATLGCMEDIESTCQAYDAGPGGEGPDGHWIQLGAAYWGLKLSSTVDKGDAAGSGEWPFYDTDCFFTDADGNVVGDGHNSGAECASDGIPAGAEWLFLFPYLTPAIELTVDVSIE